MPVTVTILPLEATRMRASSSRAVQGMGYIMRRMALLNEEGNEERAGRSRTQSVINSITGSRLHSSIQSRQEILAASISCLPLESQKDFRRKMLSIFACHLLIVWILVSLMCFITSLHDLLGRNFSDHNVYVMVPGAVAVVCLVLLYAVRELYPWNWLVVVVFSVPLSVFYVGVGSIFGTYIPWYTCAFNLFQILLMIFFSTRVQPPKVTNPMATHTMQNQGKLMSSMRAGILSYTIIGTIAVVLYFVLLQADNSMESFVSEDWKITTYGFIYMMLMELFVILWFSYDTSCMYCALTPDEYMRSIIYFYTDVVILCVFVMLLIAFSMGCSLFTCTSRGGGCNCCTFDQRRLQPEETPA